MRIGVPREVQEGERRVAIVPETVKRLIAKKLDVSVESGAGLHAGLDFLMPYVEDPAKPWPYEKEGKHVRNVVSLLWRAAAVYGDPRYRAALVKTPDWQRQREALFDAAK